jgi:hypothetical protein
MSVCRTEGDLAGSVPVASVWFSLCSQVSDDSGLVTLETHMACP